MERYFLTMTTERGTITDPDGMPFLFPADAVAFAHSLARRIADRRLDKASPHTVTVHDRHGTMLATISPEKPKKLAKARLPRPSASGRRTPQRADQPVRPR